MNQKTTGIVHHPNYDPISILFRSYIDFGIGFDSLLNFSHFLLFLFFSFFFCFSLELKSHRIGYHSLRHPLFVTISFSLSFSGRIDGNMILIILKKNCKI